jgi:hypothetical protein
MNKDILKLFDKESDLRHYLKVNGHDNAAIERAVKNWKNPVREVPTEIRTVIRPDVDESVESKNED